VGQGRTEIDWRGRHGLALALAPAVGVLLIEAANWVFVALSGTQSTLRDSFFVLLIGAGAGILAPLLILATRQENPGFWCVVSVCVSSLGIFFGFLLWLGAFGTVCHGCLD
jgi:hypothetical protein